MSEEQGSLEEWAEGGSVDVTALDNLVKEMKAAEAEYDEAKKVSTEKLRKYEEIEKKVIDTLVACGKSKWFVDGMGTAYLINKYVVKTPKTNEEKKALFDYINNKYGSDTLIAKLSINHNTLNSFVNEERDLLAKEGKLAKIPGIEDPTHETYLGFRKG